MKIKHTNRKLLILIIMFFVLLGILYGTKYQEPHFTIYKEECVKGFPVYVEFESERMTQLKNDYDKYCIIYEEYDINVSSIELCNKILLEKQKEDGASRKRANKYFKENNVTETCKIVEVDEIEICGRMYNLCIEDYEYSKHIIDSCKRECVNSKEITIDWLNENAECEFYYSNKFDEIIDNKFTDSSGETLIDYYKKKCNSGSETQCKVLETYKCIKYKLNDYIIEVK